MNCPNCGATNPDGAAFCISCGSALAASVSPAKTQVVTPPTSYREAASSESYAPQQPYVPANTQPKKESFFRRLGKAPIWAILLLLLIGAGVYIGSRTNWFGLAQRTKKDTTGTWVATAEVQGVGVKGTLDLMDSGDAELTLSGQAMGFSMNFATVKGQWSMEGGNVVLRSDDLNDLAEQYGASFDGQVVLESSGDSLILNYSDYHLEFVKQ